MPSTFERIKTIVDNHPEFFETRKSDIGYNTYPVDVGKSAEIDFFYIKGDQLLIKRRRTSHIAQEKVVTSEKYGNTIVTFAKTGSGSMYVAIKFEMAVSLYEIIMAHTKIAPPESGKYSLTTIVPAAIGPVICEHKVKEKEVSITKSLKITENIFVIETSNNETFLVRVA